MKSIIVRNREILIIVLIVVQIEMEQHRRHHHREHYHFPAFTANTVSGSGWALDYIRVRSGCGCEIRPKPKKKKFTATKARRAKSKQRHPRDQELDFETWKCPYDSRPNDSILCSNCVATDRRMRVRMWDYVRDVRTCARRILLIVGRNENVTNDRIIDFSDDNYIMIIY